MGPEKFQTILSEISSVSKSLAPDQAHVGSDLGSNYLQRLSADDTSRQTNLRNACIAVVWYKMPCFW